jgi:hypothetical protein
MALALTRRESFIAAAGLTATVSSWVLAWLAC